MSNNHEMYTTAFHHKEPGSGLKKPFSRLLFVFLGKKKIQNEGPALKLLVMYLRKYCKSQEIKAVSNQL